MCSVSPHFLSILTIEVFLSQQEHTLKIGWKEVTQGGKQVTLMGFFVQEGHLDVAFLNDYLMAGTLSCYPVVSGASV